MADSHSFRDIQVKLASHIRDPSTQPAPENVEDRRLAIYRDLFFNNVSGLLAGTFPVLHEILGTDKWQELVRDYFAKHKSHTPYFLEISRDFLGYLENEREGKKSDPPFLLELAHYEWIELAISVADEAMPDASPDGDLMEEVPVVSPLAQVLCYRFPVHQIGPDFQPQSPSPNPTWLVVSRDHGDKVSFLQINEVTARLLTLAADAVSSGQQILQKIAEEMQHEQPDVVIAGGRDLLQMLREKDIILGTRDKKKQDKENG